MECMLTQVLYREHKLSFDISTKNHLLEFSTFSRLPSTRLSYIVTLKHVGHLGYNLLNNKTGTRQCTRAVWKFTLPTPVH